MKLLFVISIIIIITSILIFINTVEFTRDYNTTEEIKELFTTPIPTLKPSIDKNKGKYCFDTCPSRNTIRNEILILKDYIDALDIKITNFDDKMDDYSRQLNEISDNQKEDRQDSEEQYETLKNSQNDARNQTSASLAKPASQMSGLSEHEANTRLQKHLSTKVTQEALNDFIKNANQPSKEQVNQHNRKMAKLYDSQSPSEKKSYSINGEETANRYINKNRAQCICPEAIKQQNPGIEENIINSANSFGFKKHWHGLRYCRSTSSCAKKYAKSKLKDLCNKKGCQVVNPDGEYPYTLEQINKLSKGKRPKHYNFPQ